MERNIVSVAMLTLLLTSMLTLAFNVQSVRASGTIYITSDYTFTDNIYEPIVVLADNIVIDGNGYILQGSGAYDDIGIDLTGRRNVTIKNVIIEEWGDGIYLIYSSNNAISGNNITNNVNGTRLSSSSNNSLFGNNVTNNDWCGILLESSNDNSIYGNNITNNWNIGIRLSGSSYNSLYDNILSYNEDPVYLIDSSHNSLFRNIVTNNMGGFRVSGSSSYNILFENTAANNYGGIQLDGTHNTLYGNIITNNSVDGISLGGSNNSLYDNHITNNEQGIKIWYASDNIIFHNSFTENTEHVHIYTSGYANVWDNGYPSGGNYWSDYTTKYPDAQELDGSGIWDTPYVIDYHNRDRYPLMNPWTPTPDFSVMASPTSLTIQQGNSDTSVITVMSLDEFNQPVQLSLSGAPSGVTTALNPEQVTPPPDAITTSTLTVSVATTTTPGSYTLTVTGTSGTLTHSVAILLQITSPPSPVNQPPVADTGPDLTVSSGDSVSLNGSNSYDPDGTIISYRWNFGDGATEEGEIVSHRFRGAQNKPKTYTVTLTVEDNDGATTTDTAYVTVDPLQRTVEVSKSMALAKMTVTYNWVNKSNGEEIYIISKLHVEAEGFVGVFVPTIWVWEYWDALGEVPAIDFLDYLFVGGGQTEKTYEPPFPTKPVIGTSPPITTQTFVEGTFQGIQVKGSDVMSIYVQGFTLKIGWPPIDVEFFEFSSNHFVPYAPPVEPGLLQELLDKLLDLLIGQLGSPGEIRVYDSQGHVTGLVHGEVREEIPNSAYINNMVLILSQGGSYRYEVAGTEDESYGLMVASFVQGESNTFTATDIPISTNAVHQYTIDWVALSQGEERVTVKVDSDSDGVFELTFTSDSELTLDEFMLEVPSAEAFPMWIVGVAVAAIVVVTIAIAVIWRRRKQTPIESRAR